MPRILKKEKVGNRRIFYLFGHKILSYHKKMGGGGGDLPCLFHLSSSLNEIKSKVDTLESNLSFIKGFLIENNKDNLNAIFNTIYKTNYWGNGSGQGSIAELCADYVVFLQDFFVRHNIKSIVDCGCGDWQFSKNIDFNGIDYKGFDVASFVVERNLATYKRENVNFFLYNGDFSLLPSADLLICKDVLQHLSNAKIQEFIDNLHKFKFALITNVAKKQTHIRESEVNTELGENIYRAVDLRKFPFNLKLEIVHIIPNPPFEPDIVMLYKNPKFN